MRGILFRSRCAILAFGRDRCGSAAVEFGFVSILVVLFTMGLIDVGRAMWSYSTLGHAAREAGRFASLRGAESLAPATTSTISDKVAAAATGFEPSDLTVAVTWDPNNNSGSTVTVNVTYQFDFLLASVLPLSPMDLVRSSTLTIP